MTKTQVKKYISETTPFEEDELDDPILNRIINNSLKVLNRYQPKLIRGDNSFLSNYEYIARNIRPLRTYQDKFTHAWAYQLSNADILESGGVSGFFVYYAIDYILEDIDEPLPTQAVVNSSGYYYFTRLLEVHAYMYCGNKRRSAILNELPFDIKGDSFYDDGKQMLNEIIIEMQNAMDGTI